MKKHKDSVNFIDFRDQDQLCASCSDDGTIVIYNLNISQVGTEVNYPIRAMDFDTDNNILYTGDEMGYIQRWDLTSLFSKLDEV